MMNKSCGNSLGTALDPTKTGFLLTTRPWLRESEFKQDPFRGYPKATVLVKSEQWHPWIWKEKLVGKQSSPYLGSDDYGALQILRKFEVGIRSSEIQRLTLQMATNQYQQKFFLCLGDCAEQFSDCTYSSVLDRLRLYYHASLLFERCSGKSVTVLARAAGQYAKPRSSLIERMGQASVPSYFGDIINSRELSEEARRQNPLRMIRAAAFARTTILFMREALLEYEMDSLNSPMGSLPADLPANSAKACETLLSILKSRSISENKFLSFGTSLFTAHEALLLPYEASLTRWAYDGGWYNESAHFVWIGERTRALHSAHTQYMKGIRNPIGIKVGPNADVFELVKIIEELNPTNQRGKIMLITRLGAAQTEQKLPEILKAVHKAGLEVLFGCDPMHGNTISTKSGTKTRHLWDIMSESSSTVQILSSFGLRLSALFLEAAGGNITECVGGESCSSEAYLRRNYQSSVDPRLNYLQALQVIEHVARGLSEQQASIRTVA